MSSEEGSKSENVNQEQISQNDNDIDETDLTLDTFEPAISASESSQKSIDVRLNPSTLETLAQNSPQELIELADQAEERIYNFSRAKEEHDYNLNQSKETTNRLIIIAGVLLVIAGFIYSGFTGDRELPEKLVNIALGALGGIGGYKLFAKKE
ncbi:MAG: hypothetical protein GVY04_04310 [Cyanobacteria bacterium]|jgi:hypothetical protein|nr:hypothetical protein [Cyanobacteria bacterium GSL.Bin1]